MKPDPKHGIRVQLFLELDGIRCKLLRDETGEALLFRRSSRSVDDRLYNLLSTEYRARSESQDTGCTPAFFFVGRRDLASTDFEFIDVMFEYAARDRNDTAEIIESSSR